MEDILEIKEKKINKPYGAYPKEHQPKKKKSLLSKIAREPFLHFILLGVLIYVIADYIKAGKDTKRYEINISDNDLYRIASLWEKQYGTIPTQKELENIVHNFVREEVFYREGLEMGLDKEDEVVRRRIAQKLEFLQQDLVIVNEPSEEELQEYFEKNTAKYLVPEKISFTHVFFSPDKGGDENAIQRANEVRKKLLAKEINRAPESGDRFPFLFDYSDISQTDLVHLLGESDLSEKVYSLPAKEWSEPLKSGYGYHLVYINSKKPDTLPALSEVREKVKADYLEEARLKKNEEAFEKVKNKYTINKPDINALQ
jgi:peptidyl-prolyl cis-trans isomerase C